MPQERACKPQQLELVLHSVVNATAPANVRAVEFTFSMNGLVELDRAEAIRCFSELFSIFSLTSKTVNKPFGLTQNSAGLRIIPLKPIITDLSALRNIRKLLQNRER